MTSFDYVMALVSIITSLALTHLISGAVGIVRNTRRVRFSLVHALWMWSAFATTVGNWASNWELRSVTAWPAWTLLLLIATTIAQYAFCAFVTPEAAKGEDIDLVEFHLRERRRYLIVVIVFAVLALAFNFAFGGAAYYAQWLRDSALSLVALAMALLGLFVGARWAQALSATVFAALASYFLVVTTNIGGA